MNSYPLPVALKIPTGWIVHWNALFDTEPVLPDGSINRDFNTSADLIWLEQLNLGLFIEYLTQMAINNRPAHAQELTLLVQEWANHQTLPASISIDVGWHYRGEDRKDALNGFYRLVILRGDWSNILYEYETRSTTELVEKLNHCLNYLDHYIKSAAEV